MRDDDQSWPMPIADLSAADLSARDYFAAMALQAILAGNEGRHENRWDLARDAYNVADAMLEVRDEQ